MSYLEIYNDAGYDLLDPARNIHGFEDLPRVSVFEDASSGVALRNLSLHGAPDEEACLNLVSLWGLQTCWITMTLPGGVSLKMPAACTVSRASHMLMSAAVECTRCTPECDAPELQRGAREQRAPAHITSPPWLTQTGAVQLFLGDTNRAISETPMNLASSRSHCIFTLHIEARQASQNYALCHEMLLWDLRPVQQLEWCSVLGQGAATGCAAASCTWWTWRGVSTSSSQEMQAVTGCSRAGCQTLRLHSGCAGGQR